MKRTLGLLLLAAAALSVACSDSTGTPKGGGRLRFVHVSPDAPDLSLVVDGDTVSSNIAYLGSSEYLDLQEGGHVIQVADASSNTTLIDQDLTVADQTDYTMLVADTLGHIRTFVLTDDNSTPPAGTARVRAVHAAPGAPVDGVDVYVTEPDADLTLASPTASGVKFGQVLPAATVNAGTPYQIRVTEAGSKNVLIDSGPLTLEGFQVRTVIAVDAAGGGEPLNFLVLNDLD